MAIESQWMQNRTYSAREDRALIAALWDEGIMGLTHFKVSQHSPSADMSVDVAVGKAVVAGDDQPDQGSYLVSSTTIQTVTLSAAPGANSRYDRIILQVRDPDASGASGDDAIVTVVTGTAAASPTIPATPASAISLAVIGPIGVGKTTILTADIADTRVLAGAKDTPGVMKPYTGSTALVPNGWLFADGTAVTRTGYPELNALYAALGYPFGAGNGSTTFNLPDARDRQLMAVGATLTTQGATGGASSVTITANHLPVHTHSMAHTHAIDHNHASATTSTNGDHTHVPNGLADTYEAPWTSPTADNGAAGATTGTGGNVPRSSNTWWNRALDSAGAHTHTLDLPNFTGTSGAASTANTGNNTTTATALPTLDPYLVVAGYIVRT